MIIVIFLICWAVTGILSVWYIDKDLKLEKTKMGPKMYFLSCLAGPLTLYFYLVELKDLRRKWYEIRDKSS